MNNNYTMLHCHTQYGNGGFIDSVASYKDYIDRAKELGMIAIAITEHGGVWSHYNKKKYAESQGLKFIHGSEFYVTATLTEKIRDNMHCCLYAKNFEGFKELNRLSSKSFNRKEENRFHYNPRITLDELMATSENIIITTACIGGILGKGAPEVKTKFIEFMIRNRDRCFLEIQPHNVPAQNGYNEYLLKLHNQTGLRLSVGTDTHGLDDMQGRGVLQKSKNIKFEDEEGWDLTFKDYNLVVEAFEKQGIIPRQKYLEALQNTNVIADMVVPYELDHSNKYPHLVDNPKEVIQRKINEGLKYRNLRREDYQERIDYELDVYEKNDALQFLLLEDMVKEYGRNSNIRYGPGRGSVTGSFIAYLLRITDICPITWNLSFERFMSSERVSLADIDSDWEPSKRHIIKNFLFDLQNVNCCEILTHNTVAMKGAIRDVGRALNFDLSLVNEISNNIESQEDKMREKYPDLFKYVDELNGTVVSVGSHPCGIVVFQGSVEEMIGTFTTSSSDYSIAQLDMKEIDSQNYVKLDILGLDNVELIAKTCEAAGIDYITPTTVDYNDESVWDSIRKNPCMIFQMESGLAFDTYRKTFHPDTLKKIRKCSPDISPIDILSMISAAIRPAGTSFRSRMAEGEQNDNGHRALNDMMADTMSYLVYQEQILDFLHLFCGFTKGEADIVRRGFAKKTGTEQFLPQIKSGFIQTMKDKYGEKEETSERLAEAFLKIIDDASAYGFSKNHSHAYSFIGYICAWLRWYYPLEFISSGLNIYKADDEKTAKIVEYATLRKISISPIKFRHSKASYALDKENNVIYKGIGSVKFLNDIVSEELYAPRSNQYDTFIDLLLELNNTSINSRQLDILIKLEFFSEFGNGNKLLKIVEMFNLFKQGLAKQITKAKLDDETTILIISKYSRSTDKKFILEDTLTCMKEMEDYIQSMDIEDFTVKQRATTQLEYLGYIDIKTGLQSDINKLFVLNVEKLKTRDKTRVWAYRVKTQSVGRGKQAELTVFSRDFDRQPLSKFDTIKIKKEWLQRKEYGGYINWYLSRYEKIVC